PLRLCSPSLHDALPISYYGAYRLKFDGALPPEYARGFEATVGLVIALTIVVLGVFGAYRGAWEYAGIFDAYRVLSAVVLSNALLDRKSTRLNSSHGSIS